LQAASCIRVTPHTAFLPSCHFTRDSVCVFMRWGCVDNNPGYMGGLALGVHHTHIRYIRNNNPHSAFAQHILNNQHEYGTIEEIMKLLKPLNHTSVLIPYELLFIQSHHQHSQSQNRIRVKSTVSSNWALILYRHT
jgi:hypothetical protein